LHNPNGGSDASNIPFGFRPSVADNTTHFMGKSPIESFLHTNEEPWTAGFAGHVQSAENMIRSNQNYDMANVGGFVNHKEISEAGRPPSDSAYGTSSSPSLPRSHAKYSQLLGNTNTAPSNLTSPSPQKAKSRGRGINIPCGQCKKTFSCNSDYM
jgi:hypothetical protein